MTMTPSVTVNCSLTLCLSVLRVYNKRNNQLLVLAERDNPMTRQRRQTQQSTPRFGRVTYNNDDKQQWWW